MCSPGDNVHVAGAIKGVLITRDVISLQNRIVLGAEVMWKLEGVLAPPANNYLLHNVPTATRVGRVLRVCDARACTKLLCPPHWQDVLC